MESSLADFNSISVPLHIYGTFDPSLSANSRKEQEESQLVLTTADNYGRRIGSNNNQKTAITDFDNIISSGGSAGGGGSTSSGSKKGHRRQSSLKRALAAASFHGSTSSVPTDHRAKVLTVFDPSSANSTLSHSSHLVSIPTTATVATSGILGDGSASSHAMGGDVQAGGISAATGSAASRTRHYSQPKKVTFDSHDSSGGGMVGSAGASGSDVVGGDSSIIIGANDSTGDISGFVSRPGTRGTRPRRLSESNRPPSSCFAGLGYCIDDVMTSVGGAIRWGLIYSLISSLLASMLPLIVMEVKTIHPVEIALFRSIGHAVIHFLAIVIRKENFLTSNHDFIYLVLTSLSGAISLPLAYEAYSLLTLGDAAAILYSIPIMVYLLEWVLRRRSCTLFMVAAVLFTGLGVGFVFCESIDFKGIKKLPQINVTTNNVGISFALGATLVAAVQNIAAHRLRTLQRITCQFWASILCIIITLPLLLLGYNLGADSQTNTFKFIWPTETNDVIWISLSGVFSGLSHLFLEAAFGRDPPGDVALARLAEVIFVYAYQIWIIKIGLSWLSVNAALIICACAASAVYMQQYEDMTREEEHPYRPQWIN